MNTVSDRNFGILIAYIVPGFTSLLGIAYFSGAVQGWLTVPTGNAPSVGGFLYVTLASIAAGMTMSTVRWALLDSLHHATGIARPRWDFARLQRHVEAYTILEHNHYRFYQFYGGTLIALVFLITCRALAHATNGVDIGLLVLVLTFYAGSRDTLRRYYARTTQLLAHDASEHQ